MYHVGEQGARGAMQGAFHGIIRFACDDQVVVFHLDLHHRGECTLEFALWSFHADVGTFNIHLNTARNFDG